MCGLWHGGRKTHGWKCGQGQVKGSFGRGWHLKTQEKGNGGGLKESEAGCDPSAGGSRTPAGRPGGEGGA